MQQLMSQIVPSDPVGSLHRTYSCALAGQGCQAGQSHEQYAEQLQFMSEVLPFPGVRQARKCVTHCAALAVHMLQCC